MTVFLDASALVKRYVDEEDAHLVRGLSSQVLVCSELALVEIPSALWRKHRMGELSNRFARALVDRFGQDWAAPEPMVLLQPVDRVLLRRAAALTARHGLRAHDAAQLASALRLREVDPSTTFACFDRRLVDAGNIEGIRPPW